MPKKICLSIKTLILAVVLIFYLATDSLAQAQDTIIAIDKNPEKLLKKIDVRKITSSGFNFWQDKFSGHWAGIDLGFNMLLNPDYEGYDTEFMKNDIWRSNSVYLNVIQQSIGLQHNKNTIGMVTGLGIYFQSYRLEQHTTIQRLSNDIIIPKTVVVDDNQKSKLSIISLMVPVLAEFQIPIQQYKNRLYLSGGVYFAYRLSSHTKIKYRNEQKEKLKTPDNFSLYDFKTGLMVRTGYRWINVFATYELNPLFQKDKGPHLIPFTFGITLFRF